MKNLMYLTALLIGLLLSACLVPEPDWTESAGRRPNPTAPSRETYRPPASPARTAPPPAPIEEPAVSGLKVYTVHNTDAAEAAEVIKVMVPDPEGLTIKPTGKKLVIKGSAEQHSIVREILRDLDAPPKNVRIDVQFNTSGRVSDRGAGIQHRGPIIINEDGISAGSAEVILRNQSTSSRENVTQSLVASSGHSASLRVGETVPHLTWLHEYGHRWGIIRETEIEWRDVGSFLAMEPTILANGLIRIRLIPELSGRLANGERQTIQFTRVATEVIARDGVTVSIGGFSENKDFYSKFLIGRSRGENSSITDITLTPRILEW